MPKTGLKPKQRKLAVTTDKKKLTGNQWQNTVQQRKFMENWLNVSSPTFGNAYKSAIEAGYSVNYSSQITAVGAEWLTDFKGLSKLQLEHLEQKIIRLMDTTSRDTSNSPDDTKVKLIELYAKLTGKLDTKNQVNVNLVQPILGGQSVAQAKVIDQDTAS